MIELLLTSFPFVLRIGYLRWRGMPVTLYNVHRALFFWFVLALIVFFTVFYYYPKSYTGIVTFRTVPVVPESGGTVTEVLVSAGDRVAAGDLLFTVDDATERAAVEVARRKVTEIESEIASARIGVATAAAVFEGAKTRLAQSELDLADQRQLEAQDSVAFQENKLQRVLTQRDARKADVDAASARLDAAAIRVSDVLPAALESARAELEEAEVELAKTRVHAETGGVIEQLTLNVGARASRFARNPSMVIVPDRMEDDPALVVAGFSQVTRSVLHKGMAAEVACESNFNITMENTVLPARIERLQEVVATGQLAPTGRLLEPAERPQRGEIVAFLRLEYPEHEAMLVEGSGCMVQAYTTHVAGSLEGGLIAHGIEALGVLKAILLRVKVWIALAAGIGLGGGGH